MRRSTATQTADGCASRDFVARSSSASVSTLAPGGGFLPLPSTTHPSRHGRTSEGSARSFLRPFVSHTRSISHLGRAHVHPASEWLPNPFPSSFTTLFTTIFTTIFTTVGGGGWTVALPGRVPARPTVGGTRGELDGGATWHTRGVRR